MINKKFPVGIFYVGLRQLGKLVRGGVGQLYLNIDNEVGMR